MDSRPPEQINAKTTVKWTSSFADYPANASWTATVYIAGASVLNSGNGVAGSANGANFDFTLTTSHTDLLAGTYRWEIRVTKSGETYVADAGYLEVLPALASVAAGALQEQKEKDLAVVRSAINGTLTGGMQSYEIAGRAVSKIPVADLYAIESRLVNDLWKIRNPGRAAPRARIVFSGTEAET